MTTENQTQVLEDILQKDSEGKLLLNLIPSSYDAAIKTPTQESYNELMRIYEVGNWEWRNGKLPTENNVWNKHKEKTCITPESNFGYSDIDFVCRKNYSVISIQRFYEKQKITPNIIKQINEYFEKKK